MNITFRPLQRSDFTQMLAWLNQSHTRPWWPEFKTLADIEKKYGRRVDGNSATSCYIFELNDQPAGMIQAYLAKDYPEHTQQINLEGIVGIDILLGEEFAGKGNGPQVIKKFLTDIIIPKFPQAHQVMADPQAANYRSIRAFAKAGFVKTRIIKEKDGPAQLMVCKLK
jgi:RimJ/RimL family protein N-acetyltransferase